LATDGVLDTSSASEKVALQSEDFGIAVQAWMLFLSHEYVFVEKVVKIKITCSVQKQD
jgi:hypothetical protein